MNITHQIGRISSEIDLKFLPGSGTAVAKFSMAVDRKFQKDKDNKVTDFHRIQIWGKLAENVANYSGKGRLIAVSGELQNNNYEDKEGVKHYGYVINATEIKFLDFAKDKQQATPEGFQSMDDNEPYPWEEQPIF